MQLVIHPAVEESRLLKIQQAAGSMQVVNAADTETALREIELADAFFGKLTPDLLRKARRLRWVQAPTASLEHYIIPELADHPCWASSSALPGIFIDMFGSNCAACGSQSAAKRLERTSSPAPESSTRLTGLTCT